MGFTSHQQMHGGPPGRIAGCSHFSRQHYGERSVRTTPPSHTSEVAPKWASWSPSQAESAGLSSCVLVAISRPRRAKLEVGGRSPRDAPGRRPSTDPRRRGGGVPRRRGRGKREQRAYVPAVALSELREHRSSGGGGSRMHPQQPASRPSPGYCGVSANDGHGVAPYHPEYGFGSDLCAFTGRGPPTESF
jgi:hypothetical protein